jgi:eukaryotic-like serine/threonine-protein kinase
MIGQTISPYRIVKKLREGGMDVAFGAEDLRVGRSVALKFLPAHLLESEEHKARFLHEARAAAALDHPNICTVYEIGEAVVRLSLQWPAWEGRRRSSRLPRRPLPLGEAQSSARTLGSPIRLCAF